MYPIDVLSSYAICGAGALVGAAMLRPSLALHTSEADALRLCRGGFALIGLGLLQLLIHDGALPLWSLLAGSVGTVGGMSMMGWALAALAGERASRGTLYLVLCAVLVLGLAAMPAGVWGLTRFLTLGLAAASCLVAWKSRRLLMRPRNVHERLISVTVAIMVASSMLRASYLLTWDGPLQTHLLHVPPMMTTPFALMYGVMSVVFATLINNVISARLHARLHQRAVTDQLTGALSRHALTEGAATLTALVRAGQGRLAVIMVDLDHFKRINDEHGHASGDAVLCHATQCMQSQLRPEALLVRYGGEEFVALVPVTDLPSARQVAERLRMGLQGLAWSDVVPRLHQVTASVGLTLLDADESIERALARADDALYRAKNGGRNQVQMGLAAA